MGKSRRESEYYFLGKAEFNKNSTPLPKVQLRNQTIKAGGTEKTAILLDFLNDSKR